MGPFDQHTVDILQRKCSCRKWDLSGIPCKHACSAIWCRNEEPESYVHSCYSVEAYLKAYEYPILPLNGSEFWPKSQLTPPLAPQYDSEKVGRPQRMRKREQDEPPAATSNPFRLRGVKRVNKCRSCGGKDHNSRGCKKRKATKKQSQVPSGAGAEGSGAGAGHVSQNAMPTQSSSVSTQPPQQLSVRPKLQVNFN